MEIRDLTQPLIKWWWLLVAATLIAGVTSFVVASREPPIYEASTTLIVGQAISDPNPSGGEFQLSQQLSGLYADIAERDPVAFATMDALGLDWLPDYNVRALPNSQFLEIAVVDANPEVAAIVANELGRQLILQSPTAPGQEDQDRQQFIAAQLTYLEEKIAETQFEIEDKQTELGELVSARQIADTQITITALQGKLTTLQANYASLLSNTRGGATNTLSVIDYAAIPSSPIGPDVLMITLLAAAVGLSLAAAGAYLIEYLDDTIRTPDDVARITHLPVIGHIPDAKELRAHGADPKLFSRLANSQAAEAFRSLRTNLEFAGVQGAPRTVLISSPSEGQGATMVATQLAASFALAGKRVALIDANLRQPSLHEFLGIENKLGLSDMLTEDLVPQVLAQESSNWRLKYVTAGKPKENAAELLGSMWLLRALTRLRDQADVAVFLGPSFRVAESFILASKLEATLIVMRPGSTREGAAMTIMEQLERGRANVVGVVLNGLRSRKKSAISGYVHYGPSQTSRDDGHPPPTQSSSGPVVLRRPETGH
ncbi:MAG: hypothetical protein ACC647_00990 [Anaerolineales bacterium]